MSQLERVTCEFHEDLEHKRSSRLDLVDNVTRLSSERERDRSDFAFDQFENERSQRSLRDELVEADRYPSYRLGLIVCTASTSISWRCLSAMDFFTRIRLILAIRPKATDVELRTRAHLCVAYAAQHTRWTDELG